MCSEITIPYNAIDIECCIKLETDEIMLIKEVNLTKCSFNSSNLNEIRRLPNGMNDLTQDNNEILIKHSLGVINNILSGILNIAQSEKCSYNSKGIGCNDSESLDISSITEEA